MSFFSNANAANKSIHRENDTADHVLDLMSAGQWKGDWGQLGALLYASIVERNPDLLADLRIRLRGLLEDFCGIANAALQGTSSPSEKDKALQLANAVLTYVLCSLPHAEIKPNQQYYIPVYSKKDDTWHCKLFRVSPILLTPTTGFHAFTMTEAEHVYAYGFEPADSEDDSESLLVFAGLPMPVGQGFGSYVFNALNPLALSSWSPFSWQTKTLHDWLNKEHKKARIYAFGEGATIATSLLLNLQDLLKQTSTVNFYNPSSAVESQVDTLCQNNSINIEIFDQIHTPREQSLDDAQISLSQERPSDNDSILIRSGVKRIFLSNNSTHFLAKYFSCIADDRDVVIKTGQLPSQSTQYAMMSAYSRQMFSVVAFGLLVLPCRYVVIPAVRALLQHKTEALILASMLFMFSLFPLYLSPVGMMATVCACLYLGYRMLPALQRLVGPEKLPHPSCHGFDEATLMELRDDIFRQRATSGGP